MRTVEQLTGIQEQGIRLLGVRHLSDALRRSISSGGVRGGKQHLDVARATLLVGGLLFAVIGGVTCVRSNMGGDQGLERIVATAVNNPVPVFHR